MMFLSLVRTHSSKCFRFSKFNQSYLNYSYLKFWKAESPKKTFDKERFKLVYEFRYITWVAYLCRLKYTFPLLSLVAIPTTFVLDSTGKTALTCFTLCLIQWGIIITVSRKLKNLIGKVYVNKEDVKDIIISSLDQKGFRTNNSHLLEDMYTVLFKSNLYKKVGLVSVFFKNSDSDYKMFTSPGSYKFHDPNTLKILFGSKAFFNFPQSKKKKKTK